MIALDDLATAALGYAQLGYPVFPCVPGGKNPLTENGFKDASTDPVQIEAWWTQHPNANIGIPTEGRLVVDVDGANNPWLQGDARMLDLARGPVDDTPRGGSHHHFQQPLNRAWRNTTSVLAAGVDTRANGGYVLAPPSVVAGKRYTWRPTLELTEPPDRLPKPPGWLIELLDRANDVKETAPSVGGNPIPTGQRNDTLARLAGTMRRAGMTEAEILAAISLANTNRCQPPLRPAEVNGIAESIARYQPDQVTVAFVEDHFGQDRQKQKTIFSSASALCQEFTSMRNPVIHGLLREGETMNIIAAPKSGKSWLVLSLALSVSTGQPWLGFPTVPGRVLLLDNELHSETLANRIPRVSQAMQLPPAAWKDNFFVRALRGELKDLVNMEQYFRCLPPGYFKIIILDAFYRFLPADTDENDNGCMANLYNILDRCAAYLQCGFVLIHHTSKGLQSGKSVTDVGSGAGSQSRAADCHFIMRPHALDGCLAVDAVTRSWPSPQAFVIRQLFPLWMPDPALDPGDLKKPDSRSSKANFGGPQPAAPDEPEDEGWDTATFTAAFVTDQPKLKAAILADANKQGLSDYAAEKFLQKAEAAGVIFRWNMDHNRLGYASAPQPELELDDPSPDSSKRQTVEDFLKTNPEMSVREIARQCGVAPSYVHRIRKGMPQ